MYWIHYNINLGWIFNLPVFIRSVWGYFTGPVFHILIFKDDTFPMKKNCCRKFSNWLFEFYCGWKNFKQFEQYSDSSLPFNHAYIELLYEHFFCLLKEVCRWWEPLIIFFYYYYWTSLENEKKKKQIPMEFVVQLYEHFFCSMHSTCLVYFQESTGSFTLSP